MERTNLKSTKYNEGKIGIYFLKKIWSYHQELKKPTGNIEEVEWKYINGVFNTLGVGLEPTIKYLMESNGSFEDFEKWLHQNGEISNVMINHFNALIDNEDQIRIDEEDKVLDQSDLNKWDKDGYIIIKNAIPKVDCERTVDFIFEQIEADKTNPKTWYKSHPLKNGIMVQLFSSPALDKNRVSNKIKSAYQQLWNRKDLMVSMDRVSFNPPENEHYHFPGPNLHWDVSLKRPIPFGLQGLLYLTDTNENQGAFTLIPGFHKIIGSWLDNLGEGKNPRDKNLLDQFQTKSIAAEAGDFIIWNQCLPHGSSPNTSLNPRIVQYINYQPINLEIQSEWI